METIGRSFVTLCLGVGATSRGPGSQATSRSKHDGDMAGGFLTKCTLHLIPASYRATGHLKCIFADSYTSGGSGGGKLRWLHIMQLKADAFRPTTSPDIEC